MVQIIKKELKFYWKGYLTFLVQIGMIAMFMYFTVRG